MEAPFVIKPRGGFTVVEFQMASLMNANELERIGQALGELVDNDQSGKILLDFTPVQYLSSQALGIIMNLRKKMAAKKGSTFILCGVSPPLLELLKITQIHRVLKIVKDQKEATGV